MHKLFLVIVVLGVVSGGYYIYEKINPRSAEPEMAQKVEPTDLFGNGSTTEATKSNLKKESPQLAQATPLAQTTNTKQFMQATLHTNKGDIVIGFLPAQAPNTVTNFIKLAKANFYDGVKFHRVIKDFMIQGGDPLTKDDAHPELWGTGGPGYKIPDELGPQNKNSLGTISMANAGPNTGGSQFFINTKDNNFLDGKHVVFGAVIKGMDVVRAIESTPTATGDRPIEPVIIKSVTVE